MSKELWLIAHEQLIEELLDSGLSEAEAEKLVTDEKIQDRFTDLVST